MSHLNGGVDVVGIGECLVAFQPVTPGPLFSAATFGAHVVGAEANVCIGLARLGHPTAFIGRVGADSLGEAVIRHLRGEGVDVSGAAVDASAPTGIQVRERRGFGASEFLYYRRDSAGSRLCPEDVRESESLIAEARWLHLSGITPALSREARKAVDLAIAIAVSSGTSISFDLNIRAKLWAEDEARAALLELVGAADVLFAGEAEAAILVGDGSIEHVGERLLSVANDGAMAVLTLGKDGAVSFANDGSIHPSRGLSVNAVVDSVGAGDAFVAGYLSARLEGLPEPAALERGNMCGAFVVSASGDTTGLPLRHEIERLASRLDGVVR